MSWGPDVAGGPGGPEDLEQSSEDVVQFPKMLADLEQLLEALMDLGRPGVAGGPGAAEGPSAIPESSGRLEQSWSRWMFLGATGFFSVPERSR